MRSFQITFLTLYRRRTNQKNEECASIVHISVVEPPSNTADMSGEEANTVRADGEDGGDRLGLEEELFA